MNAANEYLSRGVSPTKDDVHAAIRGVSAGLYPGAFCKIVEDVGGDPNMAVVMHADGAGTKSILAYIHYKETSDASVFRGIAQDSAVMNIDDVACVGACTNFLLSNTIGRNAHRCGGDVLAELVAGYADFSASMAERGVEVVLTGGETGDVGDLVQTVIVDSTLYVRFPRSSVVSCANIAPGNVIVALESGGRATYEKERNSGIGSNGFTLARHVLLNAEYGRRFPETFSNTLASDKVYGGPYMFSDALPGGDSMTIGQALLSPTRTYVPIIRDVLQALGRSVTGIIHCTGGGQAKCRSFGSELHYVKRDLFDVPPLFVAIQAAGGIDWRQMFAVFNMGHRMEFYCEPAAADAIIATAERYAVRAKVIGEVERARKSQSGNTVSVFHDGHEYHYGA